MIGDRRAYLTALVGLDPEVAPPWAARAGPTGTTLAELTQEQVVLDRLARTSRGPLTGHGLRDLVRVLLDLSKREAARAAARGQAVRRRNVAAPGAGARRIPPTITATSTANRAPSEPEQATRAGAS